MCIPPLTHVAKESMDRAPLKPHLQTDLVLQSSLAGSGTKETNVFASCICAKEADLRPAFQLQAQLQAVRCSAAVSMTQRRARGCGLASASKFYLVEVGLVKFTDKEIIQHHLCPKLLQICTQQVIY